MKIIQDTKEIIPFDFSFYNAEVEVRGLKTGDYTLDGFEDKICIERKATTGEISLNLGQKSKAFEREFERMESYKYKYIICEFTLDTLNAFPKGSGIPNYKWQYLRVSANFLRSRFHSWADERGIEIIYCNGKDKATDVAYNKLKEAYEQLTKKV